MKAAGLDMDEMNYRERSFDEFLPWSHSTWGWTMDILKWNGNALWMKRIHRHVYKAVSDVVYVNRRHL